MVQSETLTESLGERIKTLRTERGMTLAELGNKTNLSISYLSQIERDKTSPSLATLETIARCFNTGLRYLFDYNSNDIAFVVRANKSTAVRTPRAPIERYPLMPLSGNPEIEVYRITIHPNSVTEAIEQFAGEEIVFVLDGEITILIGDEQFILKAGDSIHYDALLMHSWKNSSNQSCVMIWGRARSLSDFQSSNAPRAWNKISEENGI
jgi:transcriptional regulator with XRE-family HTH domain